MHLTIVTACKMYNEKLLLGFNLYIVKESIVIESVPHSNDMVEILWGPVNVRSLCQLKPPFTD